MNSFHPSVLMNLLRLIQIVSKKKTKKNDNCHIYFTFLNYINIYHYYKHLHKFLYFNFIPNDDVQFYTKNYFSFNILKLSVHLVFNMNIYNNLFCSF